MILGIGTDIVEIARIKDMLDKHYETFIKRVYTECERLKDAKRADLPQYYAGRWAAKEAFSKALGCGIGENCYWQDINVVNDELGRPSLEISGKAAEFAAKLKVEYIHVSISHEKEYATATVILES
jgi:holo-[acyl-carrier protein] synthase